MGNTCLIRATASVVCCSADLGRPYPFTTAMAENIYSKGTQVWFPDKELSWISGEVTAVTRNADDTVKLVFQDERGKVGGASDGSAACPRKLSALSCRKSSSTRP